MPALRTTVKRIDSNHLYLGSWILGNYSNDWSIAAKYTAFEKIYQMTGDERSHHAAANAWNDIVEHRSWVIGGNSAGEPWRRLLAPYYKEFRVDPESIPTGPGRAPFSHEAADVLSEADGVL